MASQVTYEYKIRRKQDGLFASGGRSPRFTRQGKTWHSAQALTLHLKLAHYGPISRVDQYFEIVVYAKEVREAYACKLSEKIEQVDRTTQLRQLASSRQCQRRRLKQLKEEQARLEKALAKA